MAKENVSCHAAGIARVARATVPCKQINTIGRTQMALKIERFQPEGMNVRQSGGKPSYSHVVTVSGTGKLVYTAGQLARDIDGNCVGKGDMRAQMEQTFKNLDLCLKAAGATWADVVKTNTFVTDFDEFQKCGECACAISAWRPRPARPLASPGSPVPISWSRSSWWPWSIREAARRTVAPVPVIRVGTGAATDGRDKARP